MHNYINLIKYVKRNMQLAPTSNALSIGSRFPLTPFRPLKKFHSEAFVKDSELTYKF